MLPGGPPVYKKISFLTYVICIGISIIVLRLAYLQINLTPHFMARSEKNFLRTETIPSPRGNITDRYGKLLATNRPIIKVYWRGTGNYNLTPKQQDILKKIHAIIPPLATSGHIIENKPIRAERHCLEALIAADISLEQLGKIEELFPNNPNIMIKTDFKRLYPYHTYASHIVGYLGNSIDIDSCGKMGLEKMFEHILRGKNGTMLKTINSVGKKLTQKETQASFIGDTIATTIDINLQHICETVFPATCNGTFIIMHPENGDILSLVSRPHFDPNIFLSPIDHDTWQTLQEKKPFLNRALNACYPPGSIFKLVTMSAALEHNIITPESEWNCKGYLFCGKRKNWCHQRHGHGVLTSAQALAQSCNIACYEIGKQIDIDTLAEYAHIFGLGKKTESIFPESAGLVPTKEWKLDTYGQRWWQGETLSATIGQSFLLTTPLQIACMIASIFTGKLPKPRFLMHEDIKSTPINIKQETLEFLRKSMKLVVTTGTGNRVNKLKDFEIYAKTSTAQTSGFGKRKMGTQYKEHGCFVAQLKYKEADPLIAVILIENAGTSRAATDVAKNFLIQYARLIDSNTAIDESSKLVAQ